LAWHQYASSVVLKAFRRVKNNWQEAGTLSNSLLTARASMVPAIAKQSRWAESHLESQNHHEKSMVHWQGCAVAGSCTASCLSPVSQLPCPCQSYLRRSLDFSAASCTSDEPLPIRSYLARWLAVLGVPHVELQDQDTMRC
jgi:hypothetical protein